MPKKTSRPASRTLWKLTIDTMWGLRGNRRVKEFYLKKRIPLKELRRQIKTVDFLKEGVSWQKIVVSTPSSMVSYDACQGVN
jgi:hypothetical protein